MGLSKLILLHARNSKLGLKDGLAIGRSLGFLLTGPYNTFHFERGPAQKTQQNFWNQFHRQRSSVQPCKTVLIRPSPRLGLQICWISSRAVSNCWTPSVSTSEKPVRPSKLLSNPINVDRTHQNYIIFAHIIDIEFIFFFTL